MIVTFVYSLLLICFSRSTQLFGVWSFDPKNQACRTAAVRKEVAAAIIKAVTTTEAAKNAEISKENVVVRFGEAVDGFKLPPGWDHTNTDIDWEKEEGK